MNICDVKVPLSDWITLIVGIVGFLSALVSQQSRLPSWVRLWLKRIGDKRILDAVQRAASITELTQEEKRRYAAACLQRLTLRELGFPVPLSVANLLVEHVYQKWKKSQKK